MSITRKKVVFLGPSSERYKGGIAQFTRRLADCISEVCELHFFSWYKPYPTFLISREFCDHVSETSTGKCKANFLLGYMNPISWVRFLWATRKIRPDLICMTWNHPVHAPLYVIFNFFFKHFTKAEVVLLCHNVKPHESFFGAEWLTKCCLKTADRLIVHSGSEAIVAKSLISKANVTQLFLPLHNFFVSDKPAVVGTASSSKKRLLFFGNIRAYKGLKVLLNALPIVWEKWPDVRLKIVGEQFFQSRSIIDPVYKDEVDIISLIDNLGLKEFVSTDLRYLPNEEVPGLFAETDLAVFPYLHATQSGPITVAYSYDVPVITTRVGGLPDVVKEGLSGFLVEPGSPRALADGIIKFFENPIPAAQVRLVAAQLSWDRYLEDFLNGQSSSLVEKKAA